MEAKLLVLRGGRGGRGEGTYRVTLVVSDYILLNAFLKFHNLTQSNAPQCSMMPIDSKNMAETFRLQRPKLTLKYLR